ncbi:MAG: type II toxin-antitoxin system RelE/ParE family toxin [Burkholderiales bacterium]|nr:type II toxin-antitoxin system RelE/ParE family toxin [Burkholderiales bacterium]
MRIVWTEDVQLDLTRLDAFLAAVDIRAALRVVDDIYAAAQRLCEYPELGPELGEFPGRNVRRLVIGDYELRYERAGDVIYILHAWHVKEDR